MARTRKRVTFSSSSGSEVSRKQPRRNGGEAQKQPRPRTKGTKQPPAANSGDPQPSTSAVANVKHEDEDEEELPDINPEESGDEADHDSDDNQVVESKAMRMNVASSLTCTTSAASSSSGRIVLKDTAAVQTICESDVHRSENIKLKTYLKEKLECPVCSRITLPPIMQCRNGHIMCNTCRNKVRDCPVCREADIDVRNIFAENAVVFLIIPCEFKQFGCKEEISYGDKKMHENNCKYRPFNCPYIECDDKLAASDVVDHVTSKHFDEFKNSDGPEITASMILTGAYFGGDGAWSPRMITCFDRTFFDVALTRDRCLHHWVWILGEEDVASQYLYEITAFKGNMKYSFAGEVSSLRMANDDIVTHGKCLSISDQIGRHLRDENKIRYKLKLIKA